MGVKKLFRKNIANCCHPVRLLYRFKSVY